MLANRNMIDDIEELHHGAPSRRAPYHRQTSSCSQACSSVVEKHVRVRDKNISVKKMETQIIFYQVCIHIYTYIYIYIYIYGVHGPIYRLDFRSQNLKNMTNAIKKLC